MFAERGMPMQESRRQGDALISGVGGSVRLSRDRPAKARRFHAHAVRTTAKEAPGARL
jgi:hypothetical protein